MLRQKIVALSTSFMLLASSLMPASVTANTDTTDFSTAKVVSERVMTRGASLQQWLWKPQRGDVKINVMKVDLNDPYVKVDTMAGTGGKLGNRQTVSQMATETGAVAATNGDFFVTTYPEAPLGPQVKNGEWISSPGFLNNFYAFGITKDKKLVFSPFTFSGSVTAANGTSFPLSGLNKSIYYPSNPPINHSHVDQLQLYNAKWGLNKRGIGDGLLTPTEVLLEGNTVIDMRVGGQVIDIIPEGQQVIVGNGIAANYLQENIQVGDTIDVSYSMSPEGDWEMVIGGYPPLILDGTKVGNYPKDIAGANARTAVAASQDQRYLYLIGVERSTTSTGITLDELADFLLYIGAWNGVNMDGGGSSTMVARPLAKFEQKLVFAPKDGSQRKVPNGLAIYSTAPQGNLQGLLLEGSNYLFVNEASKWNVFAYDEFNNPVDPTSLTLNWSLSNAIGTIDDAAQTFIASSGGNTELIVNSGSVVNNFPVEVVGKKQISTFLTTHRVIHLKVGESRTLQIEVKDKNGKTRIIPNGLVNWSVQRDIGTIDTNGAFTAGVAPGAGLIVAAYDGVRTTMPIHVGSEFYLQTFENSPSISFASNIPEVTGKFEIVPNSDFLDGKLVGKLSYDFTQGTGLKVAYAQFGDQWLDIPGNPTRMKLAVNGDESNQWLRAEIQDANFNIHYITLSPKVNWKGWKDIQVKLPEAIAYPIKLRRVYLADLEQGTNSRAKQGSILIDNIQFDQATQFFPADTNVTITLDQKTMVVNGTDITLEQAPIVVNNRTLVPVRAITEAFGGEVLWDNDERKVTLIRGETLIDLWIDDKDTLIVNGKALSSDVAPIIKNNKTLLPLRFLAENLGLTVEWNNEKREITIY